MQRCEQLAQICGTQTGTKPSVLVGGPFPLYRSAEIKTRMVRCMDDLRIYAGRCCTLPEISCFLPTMISAMPTVMPMVCAAPMRSIRMRI